MERLSVLMILLLTLALPTLAADLDWSGQADHAIAITMAADSPLEITVSAVPRHVETTYLDASAESLAPMTDTGDEQSSNLTGNHADNQAPTSRVSARKVIPAARSSGGN